jgi:hypothetical protein
MATVPITVPDGLVEEVVAAVAQRLAAPVPATAADKTKLVQDFLTERLAVALIDYRSQRAAEFARTDESDPVVAWLKAVRAARGPQAAQPTGRPGP